MGGHGIAQVEVGQIINLRESQYARRSTLRQPIAQQPVHFVSGAHAQNGAGWGDKIGLCTRSRVSAGDDRRGESVVVVVVVVIASLVLRLGGSLPPRTYFVGFEVVRFFASP